MLGKNDLPAGKNDLPAGQDVELRGNFVTLGVRRCPDGAAVIAMGRHDAQELPVLAMVLRPETVMELMRFLVNQEDSGAVN